MFFVTQLPDDVPDNVLAQLGNRIQHALRAFTPRDAKALKAAVTTYPNTDDYDLEEDLTQLGTGEAMVTILSERGAPTPVVWTKLLAPQSLMAAIREAEHRAAAQASDLWPTYAEEVDRESAREKLAGRLAESAAAEAADEEEAEVRRKAPPKQPKARARKEESAVAGFLKSREGTADGQPGRPRRVLAPEEAPLTRSTRRFRARMVARRRAGARKAEC